jgi:hypothetical protein
MRCRAFAWSRRPDPRIATFAYDAPPTFDTLAPRTLRRNPLLRGKVGIALTIDNDGRVTRAERFGSDLPDAGVMACVTHAHRLQPFPRPDTGVIRAELQIEFAPISRFQQVPRAAAPLPLDPPVARAPRSAPR